jgi:hypothetical protein
MDMSLDSITRRSSPAQINSQINSSRSTSPNASTQRTAASTAIPSDILNAQSNSENVIEVDLVDSPRETTERDAQGKSNYRFSNNQPPENNQPNDEQIARERAPHAETSTLNSPPNSLPNQNPISESVDFFT